MKKILIADKNIFGYFHDEIFKSIFHEKTKKKEVLFGQNAYIIDYVDVYVAGIISPGVGLPVNLGLMEEFNILARNS